MGVPRNTGEDGPDGTGLDPPVRQRFVRPRS